MKNKLAIIIAVIITVTIRIMLLSQAGGITYEGYETLNHVQHITETGLPMTTNELAWNGAHTTTMPAFYYILAFAGIFIDSSLALLIIPNILISTIPIITYLLSNELTSNKLAVNTTTIASAFIPLLYKETLLNASPMTLAIPLLLLTTYYFIRIGKTPKAQIPFALTAIILTLTHPISILLVPSMAITLLLMKVQKIRFSTAMAEATIFASALIIWANFLIYKYALKNFGVTVFWLRPEIMTPGITMLGVIPLIVGAYAILDITTKERNSAGHAIIALGVTTTVAVIIKAINPETGILLLGIILVVLSTYGLELLFKAQKRSRVPVLQSIVYIAIILGFILTSAIPSIALSFESFTEIPGQQEEGVIDVLKENKEGATVLWTPKKSHYLQSEEFKTPIDTSMISNSNSIQRIQELTEIESNNNIKLLEKMNQYNIDFLILEQGQDTSLGQRCFENIFENKYEVYEIKCVVQ